MTQTVAMPDGTIHNFPDEATPDMMSAALGLQSQQPSTAPITALTNNARDLFNMQQGVKQGIGDVLNTGAELYDKVMGPPERATVSALGGNPDLLPLHAREIADSQRADYNKNFGSSGYATLGRIGGNVIGTLPAMEIAPFSTASFLPRAANAALQGGTAAGMLSSASDNPLPQQILTGAALGALTEGANTAIKSIPNAVKYLARGSDANIPAMQANIDSFNQAGTTPTLGQATQGGRQQWTESLLAKLPGGSAPIHTFAETQSAQIGQSANQLADVLAPDANPTTAGNAIREGIVNDYIPQQKQIQSQLYDKLDSYIPADSQVPITNTLKTLDRLSTPISGAENTSQSLINGKINQIRTALLNDTQQKTFDPIMGTKIVNSNLPYEALKGLRSQVGSMLTDGLTSDIPTGQLKQLYGAISDDLKNAAVNAGPEATQAFQVANDFTKDFHQRANLLNSIVNRDTPEKVFQAALAETPQGATKLSTVFNALPDDAKRQVSATVIRNMATATPGNQNAAGDLFSGDTFLTRWNKLSPAAKTTLFENPAMGQVAPDLQNLASVLSNLKSGSQVLANPSGTSATAANMAAATLLGRAVLTGNIPEASLYGAGIAGNRALANAVVNPNFVARMATPMQQITPTLYGPALAAALMNQSAATPQR